MKRDFCIRLTASDKSAAKAATLDSRQGIIRRNGTF